jgi:hypothetical protein
MFKLVSHYVLEIRPPSVQPCDELYISQLYKYTWSAFGFPAWLPVMDYQDWWVCHALELPLAFLKFPIRTSSVGKGMGNGGDDGSVFVTGLAILRSSAMEAIRSKDVDTHRCAGQLAKTARPSLQLLWAFRANTESSSRSPPPHGCARTRLMGCWGALHGGVSGTHTLL